MAVSCITCQTESTKYKCSTCFSPYCSLECWKRHKNDGNCKKPETVENKANAVTSRRHITEDTIPIEKLHKLGSNSELRQLLKDPLLQKLLTGLDSSQNPSESIQKAMQDPSFVQFVDICLGMVEENSNED